MTEQEKSLHIAKKYKNAERIYYVYTREHSPRGFQFNLILGTDEKDRAKTFVTSKEQEGLQVIVYCCYPKKKNSKLVYFTGDLIDVD